MLRIFVFLFFTDQSINTTLFLSRTERPTPSLTLSTCYRPFLIIPCSPLVFLFSLFLSLTSPRHSILFTRSFSLVLLSFPSSSRPSPSTPAFTPCYSFLLFLPLSFPPFPSGLANSPAQLTHLLLNGPVLREGGVACMQKLGAN